MGTVPKTDSSFYDADYFLHGKESGKSLYEDYHWLPDLTIPMAGTIANLLGIRKDQSILDFGCARGYVVKAFRLLGFEAYGVDASEWAIENGDPEVRNCLQVGTRPYGRYSWIIAKDVLEHVPAEELLNLVPRLLDSASLGIFVVVPLSPTIDQPYVVPEYELDVTHVVRWDLPRWVALFQAYNRGRFDIQADYLVPGIKDNYSQFPKGNGFIILRSR